MSRTSGIILPVASLPSPHGIGTFGQAAYDYVDFLHDAGQSWWQILPVGPTSYGDSPYQSPSTYAGNPYFVDLDMLVEDGLLTKEEVDSVEWGDDPASVDYGLLYENRMPLLAKACERGWDRDIHEVEAFVAENSRWLPDYSLFMAVKRHFGMRPWIDWPDEDIRLRRGGAPERYRELLADDIRLETYVQFLFFRQWEGVREYAHSKGIRIIGDLPIYVALDSADCWAEPEWFQLDQYNVPTAVSGCPPDGFSATGQLWGNPLYDYDRMRADGFGWWIRRVDGASRIYDVIRIDHFRGFAAYWSIPYGETTAMNGQWIPGPGMDLVGAVAGWFPGLSFIAEDLGFHTPDVAELLDRSGFPGMKVLEFAFDSRDESDYLPHGYGPHCVCYTGTHDNVPVMGWFDDALPEDVEMAKAYLGLSKEEGYNWGFIRGGMSSVADLFVAQMQDYLGLGAESRTNTPGTLGNNWKWRLLPGQATPELAAKIAETTRMYGREADRSCPKSA